MAKLAKTIFGYQIKSFEFLRTYSHRFRKHVISGIIWLEDSKRVRVEKGRYYLINVDGEIEGFLLKTNPGFRRVKRMIGRWFSLYRKNGVVGNHLSSMREACQQAEYSLRIKMIQNGRISFNQYYTAS